MSHHSILLGGLAYDYMAKLALYLKERLPDQVEVEVAKECADRIAAADDRLVVCVGSEQFAGHFPNRIILGETRGEDDTHLFRYQSRQKLYRGIWSRCQSLWGSVASAGMGQRQRWIAVTTDGTAGELLAFSMTCAQILGRTKRVLYVNFSECCGMRELFDLEEEMDMSDLFFALRSEDNVCLEHYTGRMEQSDYLLPVENPVILHETDERDLCRFLDLVRQEGSYEVVVFAIGSAFVGCEQVFRAAKRILHLTGEDALHGCGRRAWERLIGQCVEEEKGVVQVPIPRIREEGCGSYLAGSWMDGPWGNLARKYLQAEGGADDAAVAGDQDEPVW